MSSSEKAAPVVPSPVVGKSKPRLKARGSYDPHDEAGQMTATTNCCNVKIVLAMWVSSIDAQV